jgi:UDP-2-acetamido-2-deoxy-ribo-hexuluronate aminotransferase
MVADQLTAEIPFFTQRRSFDLRWEEMARQICEVLDRGEYSQGRKVAEFEAAIAAYTGAQHAIGVNNGTDALVLLLRAAGVGPGDEVIVPAFTFVASASAVALVGARPVFADIDPETYNLDPEAFDVTSRTRAVMPVHLFCQMADMDRLLSRTRRDGVPVLEDSAEAIGMRWNGVHAGLLGAGGVLSFFPTKTLGALGDAGMVLTDDPRIAERAAALRWHGRTAADPDVSGLAGVNSKMDGIQAAVLLAKLARLDEDIARRAVLADAYTERLRDTPGVLRLPTVKNGPPVFYVYLIEVERRDELVEHLRRDGIGTEVYYPTPLHLQPCFADLGHSRGEFPNAEAACGRTLALPLYPDLGIEDVDRVCASIRGFLTGRPS